MAKEPSALIKRDSRHAVVAYVREECLKHPNPKCLNDMLDTHLDPTKAIDDFESIQWLKWLMAGGPEYDLFAKKGECIFCYECFCIIDQNRATAFQFSN